jgi:glutaredoxin
MRTITLYTRPGCHLCEQAHAILTTAARGLGMPVREVNIEEDPALLERYTLRVPVAAVDGEDVLEWPFALVQAKRVLRERSASR